MRRLTPFALAALLALAPMSGALAHGFGVRYTLPVPLWLYLWGAAAAVVLSFVLVGMFVGDRGAPTGYRRYNLLRLGWFRATLASWPFLFALKLLSVTLFLLVIASGLFGEQVPSLNFAPTFVWVIWWVGLGFFTALVGNVWPLVNPWLILFDWADALARRMGLRDGLELDEPYPRRLGVWPALLLYFAFVWLEIVFEGSPQPRNIAFLALVYSIITWTGMAYFGRHAWLRNGEAFSVFFGILARFAPTEVRVTDPEACDDCTAACRTADGCVNCYECFEDADRYARQINLRPWAVGLLRPGLVTPDRLAFIVFMLASVTMDGLLVTEGWIGLETAVFPVNEPRDERAYMLFLTAGIVALPALFLAIYYGFSALIRAFGGGSESIGQVATAFVYSLVPIALAYQLAHYYTLLVIQGQSIIPLLSDPFGWGWDVFGTADYRIDVGLVGAAFAWYSQVAFIVAGHVIAVYLAHLIALRLLRDPKRALRSQYPMLALMVLYTISSLWILSQPVVEENRSGETAMRTAVTLEVR